MTIPPQFPAGYDGISRFGVWPIPGPNGWRHLVLEMAPDGEWIEASVEGEILVAIPTPRTDYPSVASAPTDLDGHEIIVYADTGNRGRFVNCDLFVDGISQTTGEGYEIVAQRQMAALDWTETARESDLGSRTALQNLVIVACLSGGQIAAVIPRAHSAPGLAAASAVILGSSCALLWPWRFAFRWLDERDLPQPWVGLVGIGVTLSFMIPIIPIYVVALKLAELG